MKNNLRKIKETQNSLKENKENTINPSKDISTPDLKLEEEDRANRANWCSLNIVKITEEEEEELTKAKSKAVRGHELLVGHDNAHRAHNIHTPCSYIRNWRLLFLLHFFSQIQAQIHKPFSVFFFFVYATIWREVDNQSRQSCRLQKSLTSLWEPARVFWVI